MIAWLLSTIVPALADSALKALFGFISQELESRKMIAQGKSAQYQADLAVTVQQATDATQVRNQVAAEPISAVDSDLEAIRNGK